MLYYCKKCGRIIQNNWGKDILQCDCCKSITYPVPEKYLMEGFDIAFKDAETEKNLVEELVKTAPEFDQYLFDHRDEILAKQSAEFDAKLAHGKAILEEQNNRVTCSYCGSTNVKRITNSSKAVHTAMFGIFSIGRNSKQWHCNNCKSDF